MAASAYDEIAEMYHTLWANSYLPVSLPALNRLFFPRLIPGASVLDVCCGSGHVTAELVRRGYKVMGIDNSAALIEIARAELPQVDFRVQDARHIALEDQFDGALSTFDSLNHILTLEDLHAVFLGVFQVLRPGTFFLFDMNLEEAYSLDLQEWVVSIRNDSVGLSRALYDTVTHTAHTELIWFRRNASTDCWQRRQSIVEERCYEKADLVRALQFAGFHGIEVHPAADVGIVGDFAHGRYFFLALR
jgi:SAM-dependent methyltransferase